MYNWLLILYKLKKTCLDKFLALKDLFYQTGFLNKSREGQTEKHTRPEQDQTWSWGIEGGGDMEQPKLLFPPLTFALYDFCFARKAEVKSSDKFSELQI